MTRLINPVPQYLDGNGDPLPSGLLYFYEAGTSTPKDTFNDPDETTANTNPVVLDAAGRVPTIFYTGLARIVLRTAAGVQVWDVDEVGAGTEFGQFSEWQSFVIYNINDFTFRNGKIYQSRTNANQGNDPASSPGANTNWKEVRFLGVYNSTITYTTGDVIQTTDGRLWRGVSVSNLNNAPASDNGTNWLPVYNVTADALYNSHVAKTGGGALNATRVNDIRDGSTYTLPLAASVSANQWIDVYVAERYKANEPVISRSGSDTITDSNGTDTTVTYNAVSWGLLRFVSDGLSNWSV